MFGHWGGICEDRFEDVDAAVACKNLGFPSECKEHNYCHIYTHIGRPIDLSYFLHCSNYC